MSTPVLHLLAGPNGSGKSSYAVDVLIAATHLPFVNADLIAAREWPGQEAVHAYDASRLAALERDALLAQQQSFVTETVFSHRSKLDLVHRAAALGYLIHLHVMLVPVELSVARVAERVRRGGHDVPVVKIRQRHARLWSYVASASRVVDRASFYDNTVAATPFREVVRCERGVVLGQAAWPTWTDAGLVRELT
ncbi:MAG: zeta toxin family protein [Nocardioides sp.]